MKSKISKILNNFISIKKEPYVYYNNKYGHTLVLAPTQVGKTISIVSPTIEMWARSPKFEDKPHLVITDPKMELMKRHCNSLIAEGYEVLCLNLKDEGLYYSHAINPLDRIFKTYKEEFDKIKEELNFNKIYKAENWLIEYYAQLNNLYRDKSILIDFNKINNEIFRVTNLLCPKAKEGEGKNKFFDDGKRELTQLGIMYILDYAILKDAQRKFNLGNVSKLLSSKYFSSKEIYQQTSFVTYINSLYEKLNHKEVDDEYFSTFLQDAKADLHLYGTTLKRLTSLSSIDINRFAQSQQPLALFLITPDYNSTYNLLITLILDQLINLLCEEGDKMNGLKRPVEFLLDEFANIPPINDVEAKFTVALGRNIRFTIILQEYKQLIKVYGENVANTIVSNCQHKIYLGAKTYDAAEYVSREMGETSILVCEYYGKKLKDLDPRWREETVRLVSPENVQQLDFCEGYSTGIGGTMQATFVPYFKLLPNNISLDCEQYFKKFELPILHQQLSIEEIEILDFEKLI